MSQSNNRTEPWRSNERYYCVACNSWMGSDRQSILIHENGKKHRENVEANLIKRREEKLRIEKSKSNLESSLKDMEKAATEAMSRDINYVVGNVKSRQSSQNNTISGEIGVAVNDSLTLTKSKINEKNVIES